MAACSYRQTLTSHRSSRGHIQLPTRNGRCQCADVASGLTGRNLASGLLKDDSMRLLIAPSSTLFAALALALLSACGIEDEGLIEPGLPAPSVADTAPSVDQIADPIDSVMPTAIRIRHCYSTCSSDPNKGLSRDTYRRNLQLGCNMLCCSQGLLQWAFVRLQVSQLGLYLTHAPIPFVPLCSPILSSQGSQREP